MDYVKNLSAAVAAFFLTACAEEIPCLATGAVKTKNGCECPKGTQLEEDFEAQTSACVADAGVDTSPSSAEDGGRAERDGGSMDAASEEGAVEQLDAGRDANTAEPADEADSMAQPPDGRQACEPTPEECDGQDNDCDGDTDEEVTTRCWVDEDGDGFAAMDAEATESCDECGPKQSSQEPLAGKVDCDDSDPMTSPGATDICGDGVDNDCDGEVDDDMNNACGGACTASLPGQPGGKCSNGLRGACAREGVYECAPDKTMRCTAPVVTGTAEECDARDNDCDGEVDEGVRNACRGCAELAAAPGATCSSGIGECRAAGTYECSGNDAVVCSATARAPTAEDCDRRDDDCDGRVDEGATNECGMACGTTCPPPCTPTAEVCDGEDNDCDGIADNGSAKNECGGPCSTVIANKPGTPCNNGRMGVCAASGTYVCNGADTVCRAPWTPSSAEKCDGLDNDCDGVVDNAGPDAAPTWTISCGTSRETVVSCTMPEAPAADCSVTGVL